MPRDDWFRRKTWTATDRAEFSVRLKRSRSAFHKAQYARIQAYELQTTGTLEALRGAIELLDMILAEWRSEAQLAAVHHQYAQCFLGLHQRERAIESFREVFCVQRQQPGVITEAHLDFGWLCMAIPLSHLFSEVLRVLDEFQYTAAFPVQIYRNAAIRAVIHRSRGENQIARDFAQRALSAASLTHSPFPRHRTLGIVTAPDPGVQAQLQSIVAS